jgi:hypothetical protein
MPEPLSSSSTSRSDASYDPSLDDAGQVCRNDVAASSLTPTATSSEPAVAKLVSSVAKPTALPAPKSSAAPSASTPPGPSTANNNAQRTSERHGIAPYADAGITGAGDSVYASAALVKGRDPKSGLEAEVLSVSAQVGAQTELQAGLVRLGTSNARGSATIEAFTARVSAGIHNDDGSTGLNFAVQEVAVGDEATFGTVNSLTLGASAGAGLAASAGKRDLDNDGHAEYCIRGSYLEFTGGLCIETPF